MCGALSLHINLQIRGTGMDKFLGHRECGHGLRVICVVGMRSTWRNASRSRTTWFPLSANRGGNTICARRTVESRNCVNADVQVLLQGLHDMVGQLGEGIKQTVVHMFRLELNLNILDGRIHCRNSSRSANCVLIDSKTRMCNSMSVRKRIETRKTSHASQNLPT